MNFQKRLSLLLFLIVAFVGCNNSGSGDKKELDGPTRGEINIVVDETFKPIIEEQINVFESLYTSAKINAKYVSEAEAFNALMNKEARLVVASRKLQPKEEDVFKSWQIKPKQIKVATDAICLIVNKANPDTVFTQERLRLVMNGQKTKWSELDPDSKLKGANDKITIVFDHPGSSTVRYIKDSLLKSDPLTKDVFAAGGNEAAIKYVMENPGAIGVIGVNWISNIDDSDKTSDFLTEIKVVKLDGLKGSKVENEFFQPYQAYLALKHYPFLREVSFILNEPRLGLGTGFANWVAGEKGQRVFLKAGLYPAYMPTRIIQVPSDPNATDISTYKMDN